MSKIRTVAINSHRHDELSYKELNKLAEQFDSLTEQDLKTEGEMIEMMCCNYSPESVFLYRISMILYNVVCERHKLMKDTETINEAG